MRLTATMWAETLDLFRTCGKARRECVAYWVGPVAAPDVVDELVHPLHLATAWQYETDRDWLNAFSVDLHRRRKTARAQVHTHAGAAFHSPTDDAWPLVSTPGFVSIVVPRFAGVPVRSDELYATTLDEAGVWREIALGACVDRLP